VPVQAEDGSLISSVGGYRYPVRHGIPDFRLFDPPYVGRGAEAEIGNQIVDASSSMAYDELLEHFEYHIVQLFQLPL
jgi:hypothetical protein